MTSGFVPAARSLDSPLVLRWIFRRIGHAQQVGNIEREHELATLLTDDLLIISLHDPRLTRQALDCLPMERFHGLEDALFEVFPSWRDGMAWDGARLLAGIAPARFIEAASREFTADSFDPKGRVAALAGSLGTLGLPAAGPARRLLDRLGRTWSTHSWASCLPLLALRTGLERAPAMQAELLRAPHLDESDHLVLLLEPYLAQTDCAPYLIMLKMLSDRSIDDGFVPLAALFEPAAPLAEIDWLARSGTERLWAGARRQLAALPHGSLPLVDFARSLLGELEPGDLPRRSRRLPALFGLAVVVHRHQIAPDMVEQLPVSALIHVVGLDLPDIPHGSAVKRALRLQDRGAVAKALTTLFDAAPFPDARNLVVEAMASLAYGDFAESLLEAMSTEHPPEVVGDAAIGLARIGSPAERLIVERWDELDELQRLSALEALERIAGPATASLLDERSDALRRSPADLQTWCALAEALPAPHRVDRLLAEWHRGSTEVDETICTLCALLDLDPPELADVREGLERRGGPFLARRPPSAAGADTPAGHGSVEGEAACSWCGETLGPTPVREISDDIAAVASPFPATIRRDGPKIGRNTPCPCGSGKKYKRCCLSDRRV